MRADLGMIVSSITMIIIIGLIVRFHTGAVAETQSVFSGLNTLSQQWENPGVLEQKVS